MKQTVGIIGGGISGTCIVLNFLRHATTPIDIVWFDANDLFCKGLAYSTNEESHLLNVRASNMSLFVDDTSHFVNWLHNINSKYTDVDFVPRKLFGRYVSETYSSLNTQNDNVTITQIAEDVTAVLPAGKRYKLQAKNEYAVNWVVLGLGNFLPSHPRSLSENFINSPNYFQNAFDAKVIQTVLEAKHVTIIGAGLTMIDIAIALKDKQFRGNIHTISPHGYLPQAHAENHPKSSHDFLEPEKNYSLSELFSAIKQQFRHAVKNKSNPQGIIDSMRPHLQTIWLNFSLEEKQRFLRHLRHKWGVARHRAPASSMHSINEWIAEKKLTVLKGRIIDINETENEFEITYTDSGSGKKTFKTNVIVNCTGPEPNFKKVNSQLVKQLISNSLIASHDLAYGLKATEIGAIAKHMYTIGPPLKGVLWESTAVPEIRVQAQNIASKIIFD